MDLSTILIPVSSGATSCEYHRIDMPMRHMGFKPSARPHNGSVYLVNRHAHVPYGRRLILDLDDYWELDPSNPFKKKWDQTGLRDSIVHNIKRAMAVLVTNEQLADKVLPLNRSVHVVPNALPFDSGQFTRTEPDFSKLVYAGGLSHQKDIEMLDGLDVTYFGGLKGSMTFPLEWYMTAYDGMGVSLVPLEASTFNSCKSNLKVLEAGAKGLACMCSNVLPYSNARDKGKVLLTEDFRWDLGLLSEGELRDSAEALAEHVREHYHLDRVNKMRKEILEHYCKNG